MGKTIFYQKLRVGLLMGFLVGLFFASCDDHQDYLVLRNNYDRAYRLQMNGDLKDAETEFRNSVTQCSQALYDRDDSVKVLLPKSMGQLLNVFQSEGNLDGCVEYFDSLRLEVDGDANEYNQTLNSYFKRDVYVLLAYSLSRTDDEQRGVEVMDEALKLPLDNPTHERLFRDYAYAAAVYFCVPTTQDKVLTYGRKALDEVKYCNRKSGAQWLVTVLGAMYHRMGKVDEALKMYQEGYELALMDQDTLGMANAKREIADYLLKWNLNSLADKYATKAVHLVEHVVKPNPMVLTEVYVTKARVLKAMKQKGKALAYLRIAKSQCQGMPYNSGPSDVDELMGSILVTKEQPCYPADYEQGMALLKSVANSATNKLKAKAYLEIAKVNIANGNRQEGEMALDSMWAVSHLQLAPIVIDGAYEYAFHYYTQVGNQAKAAAYAGVLKNIHAKDASVKKVLETVAYLEQKEKNEEAEQQEQQMGLHRQLYAVIGISLLIIFCVACFIFRRKHRGDKKKHEHEEDDRELQLEKAREVLLDVLRNKGEQEFRNSFAASYPHFFEALRQQVEGMTDKDELYFALIVLDVNNAEMAELLHVERKTIVLAKYRIRKKLSMESVLDMKNLLVDILFKSK